VVDIGREMVAAGGAVVGGVVVGNAVACVGVVGGRLLVFVD
jgi:hypothetical protein